jgi:hypothetical protein
MFNEWVLDVTLGNKSTNCYCPYEKETGSVVFGLSLLADKCPGKLVGVVHMDGNDAVEKWLSEHPEYPEAYKKESK